MLAVLNNFTEVEIKKTLPAMVAWTVRFLICGSGGSGTLETYYAERAREVSTRRIKTANELWNAMRSVLPTDATFEDVFAQATVSKSNLAKYYFRTLEAQNGAKQDELIVNPDSEKVNLEHVLPQTYSADWKQVPQDQHAGLLKRLRNAEIRRRPDAADAIGGIEFIQAMYDKRPVNVARSIFEQRNGRREHRLDTVISHRILIN